MANPNQPLPNPGNAIIDQYVHGQQQAADEAQKAQLQAGLDAQRVQQELAVASQNQQSWYSTLADNLWTDDFSAVPVVGPAVSRAAGAISAGYDALNAAESWAVAQAPGGIDPFTWDQARAITPGQAATSDAANRAATGNLLSQTFGRTFEPFQTATAGAIRGLDPSNPLNSPDFNPADAEQNRLAYENGGIGQVGTGTSDAVTQWFLDPLVVGGKAIKIGRFGSEALQGVPGMGSVALGFTNMPLTSKAASRFVGQKIDEALQHQAGIEGVPRNVMNEHADFIAANRGTSLSDYVLFQDKTNPFRNALLGIADSIDNPQDALVFLGAATGDGTYIRQLQAEQQAAYDVLTRVGNVDNYERLGTQLPAHQIPPVIASTLENGVDAERLLEDLTKRNKWLRAAVGDATGSHGVLAEDYRAIRNFGNRSATATKIAGAWQIGKTARDQRNIFGKATLDASPESLALNSAKASPQDIDSIVNSGLLSAQEAASLQRAQQFAQNTGPAGYEKIFQASANFRKVRVWSWLTGEHTSGYVTVRGVDVGTSGREVHAVITDAGVKDGVFREALVSKWNAAVANPSPEARMVAVREIEQDLTTHLAEAEGADPAVMQRIYDVISKNRDDTVSQFTGSKTAFGIDPHTGDINALDPVFRSQLETKVPVIDMRVMRKAAKIAASPTYKGLDLARSTETLTNLLDQAVSLWKAGVLLRLGYTQRNVGEGWLRTLAVLGTVPAIKAAPKGAQRIVWSNRTYKPMRDLSGNLTTRGRMARTIDRDQLDVADNIKAVQAQRQLVEQQIDATRARHALVTEPDEVAHSSELANLHADWAALDGAKTGLTYDLMALDAQRAKIGKRKLGDDGAFAGVNGKMYEDLASSRATNERVLENHWGRQAAEKMREESWIKVNPGDTQYWSELGRGVEQMRRDPAGIRAMEGQSTDDIARWINSSDGASYRAEMQLSEEEVPGRAALIHDMVNNYLPTEQARILASHKARDFSVAGPRPEELEAVLKNSGAELQPVHGREIENQLRGALTPMQALNKPINWLFKWIGTIPESRLVRQPFYNEVWGREIRQGLEIAESRLAKGEQLSDESIKNIERNAHTVALKAVKDTLYTIDRMSNPAQALRFIAPFYPAWENSMKVWAGIIVRDPSVAARASMLWQIPNQLGMVVDENGNKVESDPFAFSTGSINRYIVLPKPLQDAYKAVAEKVAGGAESLAELAKKVPGVGAIPSWQLEQIASASRGAAAAPFKVAQSSLNVVTPGSTAWLPGLGPLVTVPTGYVLASKPDTQKLFRDVLGDALYQQIVPFGVASDDLTSAVLPPVAKKFLQRQEGESSAEYLGVVDAMMQTAMVDWYKSGGDPADKPDMDVVRQKANDFYSFSALASLTLPVSLTRMSKYQTQIDYWNNLKATPGIAYQQKISTFLDKFGESYAPLLVSTSQSAAANIDPTIETWDVLNQNTGLVQDLAQLGPDAVGILGASAPLGQFDQGVYQAFLNTDIPGSPGETWKSRVSPQDYQNKIELAGAWRDYFAAKAERDTALQQRGGMSIDAKVNADLKAQWTDFTDVWMVNKYGAQWSIAYNDYGANQAKYLEGINTVLDNATFMSSDTGQSLLWSTIGQYMDVRREALAAIDSGADSTAVSDQFAAWADNLRFTSLDFADFFDQYLANDKLSIGVTANVG